MLHEPEYPFYILNEKETAIARHRVLRLLLRKSRATLIFPIGLFIEGVECEDTEPVVCGGFSDIFIGVYQGTDVALKRLRVFQRDHDEEKSFHVSTFFSISSNFTHSSPLEVVL